MNSAYERYDMINVKLSSKYDNRYNNYVNYVLNPLKNNQLSV